MSTYSIRDVRLLRVGMHINGVSKAKGNPTIFADAMLIDSLATIKRLRQKGIKFYFVDKNTNPAAEKSADDYHDEGARDRVKIADELPYATKLKAEAVTVVANFMEGIRRGEGLKCEEACSVVEKMVKSICRNADALTSLSRFKDLKNYTITHSVNVAILSLAFGRIEGLSKDELFKLGVGAILHDVGKMLVPGDILNKPERLTEDEFAEMRKHTIYGAGIIAKATGLDESIRTSVMDIAYQHHERYDGKGYPEAVSNINIPNTSVIVGIADAYDAMTSRRVYEDPNKPCDVTREIFGEKGSHFHPSMVDYFIKSIGIYPIGSRVSLSTGESAEVKSVNHNNLLRPKVTVLFDDNCKRDQSALDLDLSVETDISIQKGLG